MSAQFIGRAFWPIPQGILGSFITWKSLISTHDKFMEINDRSQLLKALV
jgi:hypothetical protein